MATSRKKREAIDWQAVRERLSRAAAALDDTHRLTPERVRGILEERARVAARVPAEAPAAGAEIEVIRFNLGTERYGIETNCVREILRFKGATPVPGTPDFVVGLINLRGQIVAVFDLRRLFGIPTPAATEAARVLVVGRERREFGVVADAVDEVAMLDRAALREPPASVTGIARDHLRGVTADALIVLDGAALLDDPRLFIDLGDDLAK